ncbi:MAG: four helix bundle protein [Planctomycetes bacterium RBG_16_43_13]|nr:MAG: four helix bundle protein [Planctomycetes bacterium RBG_16_43_13]
MERVDLKEKTKKFAIEVIRAINMLPKGQTTAILGKQLLRAGTSVGANYRSACRARSKADFISKMGIVEEEADETLYWLDLLLEAGIVNRNQVKYLIDEANEIVAIAVTSIKTARNNRKNTKLEEV